jgi:hypothetical protein
MSYDTTYVQPKSGGWSLGINFTDERWTQTPDYCQWELNGNQKVRKPKVETKMGLLGRLKGSWTFEVESEFLEMHFLPIAAVFFSALASAVALTARTPGGSPPPSHSLCPDGLFSVPQCCATDILGIADLDCQTPGIGPYGYYESFQQICAAKGQRARCCVLPVLGQAVLCIAAVA